MSSPTSLSIPNKKDPIKVNAKMTKNWMVILRSFPNMSFEIMEDKTNIHANENTKTAKGIPEFIHDATSGTEPPKEVETVISAGWVKIW